MEVVGADHEIVLSQRFGLSRFELIFDRHCKAYFLVHYRRSAKILFEFVGTDLGDSQIAYHNFVRDARIAFGD